MFTSVGSRDCQLAQPTLTSRHDERRAARPQISGTKEVYGLTISRICLIEPHIHWRCSRRESDADQRHGKIDWLAAAGFWPRSQALARENGTIHGHPPGSDGAPCGIPREGLGHRPGHPGGSGDPGKRDVLRANRSPPTGAALPPFTAASSRL